VRAETFCGESSETPLPSLTKLGRGEFYSNVEDETAKSLPLCKIVPLTNFLNWWGKNRLSLSVMSGLDKLLSLSAFAKATAWWDRIRLIDARPRTWKILSSERIFLFY